MNYRNQRQEDERKRREAFEEELKNAKKLKNEKRQINEDLMKNRENDYGKKDSTEPLQEKINDARGINNKTAQEPMNNNKPTATLEQVNKEPEPINKKLSETKDAKTPEGRTTAGDTVEDQTGGTEPTERTDFQEMMVECVREPFPQTMRNSYEEAREEMINDIRLWREEIIQLWRDEMKNDDKPTTEETPNDEIREQSNSRTENDDKTAEKEQDTEASSSENKNNRNQESSQHTEGNTRDVKKTQRIEKAEELSDRNEEPWKAILNNRVDNTKEKTEETQRKLDTIDDKIPQQKEEENYEEQMNQIIEKYAKAIRELRKERNCLINSNNHPIIDKGIINNREKCDKNTMKAIDVDHHVIRKRNFIKRIVKVNIPGKKVLLNRSRTSSIMEMTGTPVRSKPNDGTIDSTCYTIRRTAKEKLQRQPTDQELTEKGLDTTITTNLKLKETLTTTKWKDKMIMRYIANTGDHPNTKMIRTSDTPKMIDHG